MLSETGSQSLKFMPWVWCILASCWTPAQPLSHSPSSTEQGEKKIKKLVGWDKDRGISHQLTSQAKQSVQVIWTWAIVLSGISPLIPLVCPDLLLSWGMNVPISLSLILVRHWSSLSLSDCNFPPMLPVLVLHLLWSQATFPGAWHHLSVGIGSTTLHFCFYD